MYTDISTENAMLQGSRRLSKGVEYLVEASAAEAEAINATLAAAKARQVNGEVELPDQDTLNLNGPPFNTHEVQTDTTDKSVSVRNISKDSLVVSDGKMTTDENSELVKNLQFGSTSFQNLLTSSSNLASISSKLSNTSPRNHFPVMAYFNSAFGLKNFRIPDYILIPESEVRLFLMYSSVQ